MASIATKEDKATNVNLKARKPHVWHVDEIITLAYTKRSVDIENPEVRRGPASSGYPADRYVLHTMEETGIFKLDTTAFINFCTKQVISIASSGSTFRLYETIDEAVPCTFIEFLILNNMFITFREVIQHNDPVFRYPNGDGCYHFKVLMTLLGTSVDCRKRFGFLGAVPIQQEWKDSTWWVKMKQRAGMDGSGCWSPLYMELINNNIFDRADLKKMKRRLHYLSCNAMLKPMWEAGLLRWYHHEAHSIPKTEEEFENEFHQNFEDYVRRRPLFRNNPDGAKKVRDGCKITYRQIWEYMVELEAQALTDSEFKARVPLCEYLYMNTATWYPNVGDEVIYMGKKEAYRGKHFQVVKCVGKLCVLFNKTEVECEHALTDVLKAVESCYHLPTYPLNHLPGENVKMITAAMCDLQFISTYTPKVGDYCTVSTMTFPQHMKHVVEITRVPDNDNGEYTIENNSRAHYAESKVITVRYEGTKKLNCADLECQKVHVFTILPDNVPLYVDMQTSYRSALDVFKEDVEFVHTPPSGIDMIIQRWIENWNFAILQPYAQYQHKMYGGKLQTFVAQYIPYGVRDCLLPATPLTSTCNDVYIKFEDSSCFDNMLHPGQQVEMRIRNVGLKYSGIIKYIVKHKMEDTRYALNGLRCLDIFVIEMEKTRNCPRSIRLVNRSDIVSVESPDPHWYNDICDSHFISTMKGRVHCNGLRKMPKVMTLDNFRSLLPYLTQLFKEDDGDIERYQTIRNDVSEHDVNVHDAIPFSSQIYALPVEVGTITAGKLVSYPHPEPVEIDWEKDGNGHKRYHALHLCQYLCQNSFVHGQLISRNRITGDRWFAPRVTYVEPTNARWPLKNETPIRTKIDVVRFLSQEEILEHRKKYEERKAALESGKKRSVDNSGNSGSCSTPEKRMRFDRDALKQQQIQQMRKMISDNKERLEALILRRAALHTLRVTWGMQIFSRTKFFHELNEIDAEITHLQSSIETLEKKLSEKTKK